LTLFIVKYSEQNTTFIIIIVVIIIIPSLSM